MSADSKAPSGQPGPADTSKRHKEFFWEFSQFKVEDRVFQLPIVPFILSSEVFALQYGLVEGDNQGHTQDNSRRCRQAVFLDVKLADFEAFLKGFLPLMYSAFPFVKSTLSKTEWVSVLKLSTLWSFKTLRSRAINRLYGFIYLPRTSDNVGNFIEFVGLARQYFVSSWLTEAYTALADIIAAVRPLTFSEAGQLGYETAHELQGFALRGLQSQDDTDDSIDLTDLPLFRAELDGLREEEDKYDELIQIVPDDDGVGGFPGEEGEDWE